MIVRSFALLAAALGLWLTQPLLQDAAGQGPATRPGDGAPTPQTAEPGRLAVRSGQPLPACQDVPANQLLANTIVERLRQSPRLARYHVEVAVENGAVVLTGRIIDSAQREEVLRIVQSVQGVTAVRDQLTVGEESPIARTTAVVLPPLQEPGQLPGSDGPANSVRPRAADLTTGAPAPPNGGVQEPHPIFHAPPGLAAASMNPPPLPPYAWPTFAPYNNYSRVAYPTIYPPQAWPFIGPFYPFPKVPLGWRKIQLEYVDGHWWYGKRASGYDWWRVRYW